ncbi:MAG: alkaline phosphatase family protein, partial [Myxococcota bacterium]
MRATIYLAGTLLLLLAPVREAVATPRLAVLVVVDQLRAVDVDRLAPLFGPGGLGGIPRRGAHLTLRYSYAATETGPGHATLATGTNPPLHGVLLNHWYEASGTRRYVVDDDKPVIGLEDAPRGRGPALLRAPTLGDAMKAESGGLARVVTIAGKDRSAILTGGFAADIALWYEPRLGRFSSSGHYPGGVPSWVAENGGVGARFPMESASWTPLGSPSGPAQRLLPADDLAGEQARLGGRSFPHDLGRLVDVEKQRADFVGTPDAMAAVFQLGLAAIDAEGLGEDVIPDLLVLGVSATDHVGHWYGPGSLESVDMLRRLDLALRELVASLDQRLGSGGYVLAVTGDHGAPAPPERTAMARVPAERIDVAPLLAELEAVAVRALPGRSSRERRIRGLLPPHLYVRTDDLTAAERDLVLLRLTDHLRAHPQVHGAWRTDDAAAITGPVGEALRQSLYPGRNGEILVLQGPRSVFDFGDHAGTDHGTPWAHDTPVPLLLLGPGVRHGRIAQERDPRAVT